MSDDLIKALRDLSNYKHSDTSLGDDAADEIERLRVEVDRLNSELRTMITDLGRRRAEIERRDNVERKLVGALDMIRETLNGGNVEDLLMTINAALNEYHAVQKPTEAQALGSDLWGGGRF